MTRSRPIPLLLSLLLAGAAAFAYEAGEAVAPFNGVDEAGQRRALSDHQGKAVVVVVWSSKCPTSKAFGPTLRQLSQTYASKAAFLGVAPNAGETAATVKAGKKGGGVSFPVLLDGGGTIAKSFKAAMTPTVYVIDAQGKLRYQGAVADKPRGATKTYLADALAAVTAGKAPAVAKTRVKGFRIKY